MRLSWQNLSGARIRPLPDWLRRVAPCLFWLEDDAPLGSASAESAMIRAPPSSISPFETAQRPPAAEDECQGPSLPHLRIQAAETLLRSGGPDHSHRPSSPQPTGTTLFTPSQKPGKSRRLGYTLDNRGQCWDIPPPRLANPEEEAVPSNESEQLIKVENLRHTARSGEDRSSSGGDTASCGVSGGVRRHSAETTTAEAAEGGDACEEERTIMPAGQEKVAPEAGKPARLTFVASWRHDLIRHLIRLKRRSDIRRECGSILLLGYPVIRFMGSPWFYRLASRQAGGLLPAQRSPDLTPCSVLCPKAENEDSVVACGNATSQADIAPRKRSNAGVPVNKSVENSAWEGHSSSRYTRLKEPDVGTVNFDLLVTDSAALVKSPSLHLINCSEAVHASPAAFNFLMRRDVPEYFRTQGKAPLKINGHTRRARKDEMMQNQNSVFSGAPSVNAAAVLERPPEKQELENVRCLLALDRVKYVGNVGVLVRAAAAFGFDGIFYIDGTADPFNWKVMEVSNGLHYNLPHFRGSAADLLAQCKRWSLLPVVADTDGLSPDSLHAELISSRGICCVLGNESYGAADVLLRHCKRICIPMSNLVDSLNVAVAGGIVMYEMKKLLEHVKVPKRIWSSSQR